MSLPRVVAVTSESPAARADLQPGDELVSMNGQVPRDVIEYQLLADEAYLELEVRRSGIDVTLVIEKTEGEPLGIEVNSALFDQVRTCDNHCEFCFIYQLPKGMRRSLYLKDDDYRLSFLYGNFTTLTRFTEADLERVVTEHLSPLNVSIHSTDPATRSMMLRNQRGGPSLRWLRALLDHDIEIHGQVVVCPGINDGDVLRDTLAGVLDEYPELATLAVVPLGVSRFSKESSMRPHTVEEAAEVVDIVSEWQDTFVDVLDRRMVFAGDEYYLLANRPFPATETYEGFSQHEDGIGMARALENELAGLSDQPIGTQPGFFAWVDGAPAEGYRQPRYKETGGTTNVKEMPVTFGKTRKRADARPIGILTGQYGARVLEPLLPLLKDEAVAPVRLIPVPNEFFGGNIGVTGLMVGEDLIRTLNAQPDTDRYLLPDVCLSAGTFLDGLTTADLPRSVEVIPTNGVSLRQAVCSAS